MVGGCLRAINRRQGPRIIYSSYFSKLGEKPEVICNVLMFTSKRLCNLIKMFRHEIGSSFKYFVTMYISLHCTETVDPDFKRQPTSRSFISSAT